MMPLYVSTLHPVFQNWLVFPSNHPLTDLMFDIIPRFLLIKGDIIIQEGARIILSTCNFHNLILSNSKDEIKPPSSVPHQPILPETVHGKLC